MNTKIIRMLLLKTLINITPSTLRIGRIKYGRICLNLKKLKLIKSKSLTLKYLKIHIKKITILIIKARVSVDRGFETKFNEPNSFIRNPMNIRNARLAPTENKKVSNLLKRSNLSRLRIK